MTCDELLDHAAESARVDCGGIELPDGVRTEQQADQRRGEIGVLGMPRLTIGQTIEQSRELGHDLLVERGESFA